MNWSALIASDRCDAELTILTPLTSRAGGEDKIRVALNTCETILSHTDYIDAILDQLSALPEIAAILEPAGGRRSHVAGELSDGTPITLASANAATLMAGGSGIFANTGSQAVAAAAAAAALSSGNVSMATLAAQDGLSGVTVPTGKKSITSGTGGGAKRKTEAGPSSAAGASSSKAAAAAGSSSTKKRKTAGDAEGSGSKKASNASGAASSSSAPNRKKASAAPSSPAIGSKREDDRASSTTSSRAARAGSELEEVRFSGTRSRPARAPRATGGSGLRRRLDDGDDDGDDGGDEEGDDVGEEGERSGNGSSGSALGLSMGTKEEGSSGRFDSPRSQGGNGRNRKDEGKGGRRAQRGAKDEGDEDMGEDGGSYSGSLPMSQSASQQHGQAQHQSDELSTLTSDQRTGTNTGTTNAEGSASGEVDERRYCFCENVSYGDMIGCDDDGCTREWFHLECVGLKEPPSGTWYCDECLDRRGKRRGGKGAKVVRSEGKWGGGGHEVAGGNGSKSSSKSGRR